MNCDDGSVVTKELVGTATVAIDPEGYDITLYVCWLLWVWKEEKVNDIKTEYISNVSRLKTTKIYREVL